LHCSRRRAGRPAPPPWRPSRDAWASRLAGAELGTGFGTNPIRKVVILLQKMQKEVDAEGKKAQELFDKYVCYCKNSGGELAESVKTAEAKIPELTSGIEEAKGRKEQLEKQLKSQQEDRQAAKDAMSTAESLRSKEKAAFEKAHADSKANLAALNKAISAISKGMGSSFLQTPTAGKLRTLLGEEQNLVEADRETVLAFLSGTEHDGYVPASGEILGILKQLGDDMQKEQDEMVAREEAAVKDHEGLMLAKRKEVESQTRFIESALTRIADLGVELARLQADLEDTQEAYQLDSSFLADLNVNCKKKKETHEQENTARAEEILAIGEAIKVLNDDDSLDLFKKTLPSPAESFVQVQVSSDDVRRDARGVIEKARSRMRPRDGRHHLDFIVLALRGRKKGFDEVLAMVDKLMAILRSEQVEDDDKKEYCNRELDTAEDKQKALKHDIADFEKFIDDGKDTVEKVTSEIEALKKGIKDLDQSVAEATAQRKEENAEFKELMSANAAAKELLRFAKNRLNKFYNSKLYKAPAKRELSEEDRIYENNGGEVPEEEGGGIANTGIMRAPTLVQVAARAKVAAKRRAAPPPPPETAAAYMKKTEASGGVIAMIDLLVADLDNQMTVAETEEKNAQEEYETAMADSGEKRAQDSKALTDKEGARAELKAKLEEMEADKKSASKELASVTSYAASIHSECDWLLQYYSTRKEARADEIDSLQKAKAVLSGADYSFLQLRRASRAPRRSLRGI